MTVASVARRAPPPLAPGARVALVSPAGPLRGPDDVDRAIANVRALGWEAVVAPHALARTGYFAGDDDARAADLNDALRDRRIDGVWCLRGGYGAMRLLDRVDWSALRGHAKPILGYSDVTALHGAIARQAGIVSYHAPTARTPLSPFSRASLERAVMRGEDSCGVAERARVLRHGRARGRLEGGNLAVVAALVGTPYFPPLDGAILLLEDVNEAVYRIDRMLAQLRLSGALHGVRAIIFGECTNCPEEADDGARKLDDVLLELADWLRVPCLAGVPLGHVAEQWTVGLGALGELDAGARSLVVTPR
ncbi:MAG TPA: LD-carboxypeptidase [Gemmatimonadaceae bacterium]|nr:LD-carboxypeptidase [Gemmatimonadaceae bacterium]